MFQFLNLQPEVFGVDVNDLSLKIVKLKKKRHGFVMVSYNEVAMKPGIVHEGVIQDQSALVRAIRAALVTVKGSRLGARYAAISLPEEKSFSQVIQMPPMNHEELASAVPYEAENYIPLPIDRVYLDFEVISPGKEKHSANHTDVLINVIPKPIIDAYVATFKSAGVTPYILEVESQAIARALVKNGESLPPVIFIDLGNASTSFIIFSSGAIRFTSSIPISSEQLTKAIADNFKIDAVKAEALKVKYGLTGKKPAGRKAPGEALDVFDLTSAMNPILVELADQIKKYITFYRDHVSNELVESAGNIQKILLCGGGANLKGLPEFLHQHIGLPVEIGNPLVNLVPDSHKHVSLFPQQKALSFTTALGLALRGADQKIYD